MAAYPPPLLRRLLLPLLLALLQPAPDAAADPPPPPPTAVTTNGAVSGSVEYGVASFLGIPFAAAPTGGRRFLPPTAHAGWNGTRAATVRGHSCLQGNMLGSEDCLFINAFTPVAQLQAVGATEAVAGSNVDPAEPAHLLPVMFYIHGGGFVGGSAISNGQNISHLTGHVVFACQYRLGVLGFLSPTPTSSSSSSSSSSSMTIPNVGLADQRFALQWVRDNARAFGGDPDNILIYGCSAGGASVAGMLTMPEAFGMYTAAAIESPGGHQGWMGGTRRSDDDWMSPTLNANNSAQLASQLGCGTGTGSANLACLQAVDASKLLPASQQLRFAPALPEEGAFPLGRIRRGEWNKVPVVIGGQSCESCGDARGVLGPYTRDGVTEDKFRQALASAGFSGTGGSALDPDTLMGWYADRIAAEGYWRTFARILSDSGHACSSALHAEALGATAPAGTVWRYFFAYSTDPTVDYGALHGGDETWLLDLHEQGTEGEVALSRSMGFWWASLNTHGDPNAAPYTGAPEWAAYDPNSTSSIDAMFLGLRTDPTPRMNRSADTLRPECEHWKAYLGW